MDGEDKGDIPWKSTMPPTIDPKWIKCFTNPFGKELFRDTRNINSKTPYRVKVSIVNQNNELLNLNENNIYWNFDSLIGSENKNIILEEYGKIKGIEDINQYLNNPENIKQSWDMKANGEKSFQTEDIQTQTNGEIIDNFMVKFYDSQDCNLDGNIDLNDFAVISKDWGKTGITTYNPLTKEGYGDINRDGNVDTSDLVSLINTYSTQTR